ncbi:hypothetical protein ATKI12_7829 [Kitasatospora sp. Ki12]
MDSGGATPRRYGLAAGRRAGRPRGPSQVQFRRPGVPGA